MLFFMFSPPAPLFGTGRGPPAQEERSTEVTNSQLKPEGEVREMSLEQITTRVDGEYRRVRAEEAVKALQKTTSKPTFSPPGKKGLQRPWS